MVRSASAGAGAAAVEGSIVILPNVTRCRSFVVSGSLDHNLEVRLVVVVVLEQIED